jgi:hypothetical protein
LPWPRPARLAANRPTLSAPSRHRTSPCPQAPRFRAQQHPGRRFAAFLENTTIPVHSNAPIRLTNLFPCVAQTGNSGATTGWGVVIFNKRRIAGSIVQARLLHEHPRKAFSEWRAIRPEEEPDRSNQRDGDFTTTWVRRRPLVQLVCFRLARNSPPNLGAWIWAGWGQGSPARESHPKVRLTSAKQRQLLRAIDPVCGSQRFIIQALNALSVRRRPQCSTVMLPYVGEGGLRIGGQGPELNR